MGSFISLSFLTVRVLCDLLFRSAPENHGESPDTPVMFQLSRSLCEIFLDQSKTRVRVNFVNARET